MSGCLTLAINKGRDYLTLLAAVVVPALKTIQPFKVLGCKQRIGSGYPHPDPNKIIILLGIWNLILLFALVELRAVDCRI